MKGKISLGKKAVLATIFLAFVLSAVVESLSYRIYGNRMDEHYRVLATNVAKTAAAVAKPAVVEKYAGAVKEIYLKDPAPEFENEDQRDSYLKQYDAIKDEGYEELLQTLQAVKESNQILSLYLVTMDVDSKSCVYVVDASEGADACPAGIWDPVYEQNYEILNDPERGFPAYITNTEEYGWLCSAGVAVHGSSGQVVAYAMADVSMNDVMKDRHDFLRHMTLSVLIATIILSVLFIRLVDHAVVGPVNRLSEAASSYVADREQGCSALEMLRVNTGDEIEHLCDSFRQMEKELNQYIENLTTVTAEKERIGAELSVATHIQASMLPCIFPPFPDRKEFDIYASMNPAKEVGGDFYDFYLVDEDHLAVVIADVSGKGVPAALVMVITKTLLKDHVFHEDSLGHIFEKVNDQLCENNKEGMFVTTWMGVLQISTGVMEYVNAGHNPPLVYRKGETFEYLETDVDFVLAGMDGIPYTSRTIKLDPGDVLYLYTDGATEAINENEQMFGEERLKEVLDQNQDKDPEGLLKSAQQAICEFVGNAAQFDDITMLALKINRP